MAETLMTETLINLLPEVIQTTYFQLNPLNPNNTEDNYQELLRINLERLSYSVYSEISVQKEALDIHGALVKLKNKTERYDLVLDSQEVLMELKNLVELDEYSVHQMLSYLDHSDYRYGILINFAKANKKNAYQCSFKVYRKDEPMTLTDMYGTVYHRFSYTKIHEFIGENYWDLVYPSLVTDSLEHMAAGTEGDQIGGIV